MIDLSMLGYTKFGSDLSSDVDFNSILETLKSNFEAVLNDNVSIYSGYDIRIALEQQFIKEQQLDPSAIYIVLKISPSSTTFGQVILPINIIALSEEDKLDVCQRLFFDMAQNFNLAYKDEIKSGETCRTLQIYQTPFVSNNFESVNIGFRSLIECSATFVITHNVGYFDFYYSEQAEGHTDAKLIPCISSVWSSSFTPDSQVMFNGKNFSRTEIQYGVNTFQLTTFLFNNSSMIKRILEISFKRKHGLIDSSVNEKFYIGVKFQGIDEIFWDVYKMVNQQSSQQITEIPSISITFTN